MKITIKGLRKLIIEEIEQDPFPSKKKVTMYDAVPIVEKAESVLSELVSTLDQAAAQNRSKSVRSTLKKAAGLAKHASEDLLGVRSMLEVALDNLLGG